MCGKYNVRINRSYRLEHGLLLIDSFTNWLLRGTREKDGSRDSVGKTEAFGFDLVVTEARGPCFSFTRHGVPSSNHIIARSLIDVFLIAFTKIWSIVPLTVQFVAHFTVAREMILLLWTGCQGAQIFNCHGNLNTCFTWLSVIQLWWKLLTNALFRC